MKKLIIFILLVLLVVYFAPRLVHQCDFCNEWFIGTGYEANVLSETISSDELIICKSCAEKEHAIGTTFGNPLDDYKRSLFE